jgi:hypothetical protein
VLQNRANARNDTVLDHDSRGLQTFSGGLRRHVRMNGFAGFYTASFSPCRRAESGALSTSA